MMIKRMGNLVLPVQSLFEQLFSESGRISSASATGTCITEQDKSFTQIKIFTKSILREHCFISYSMNITMKIFAVALVDLGVRRSLVPQGINGSDSETMDFSSFLLLYGSLSGLTAAGQGQEQGQEQGQGMNRAEKVPLLWVPTARGMWREV